MSPPITFRAGWRDVGLVTLGYVPLTFIPPLAAVIGLELLQILSPVALVLACCAELVLLRQRLSVRVTHDQIIVHNAFRAHHVARGRVRAIEPYRMRPSPGIECFALVEVGGKRIPILAITSPTASAKLLVAITSHEPRKL